MLKKVSLFVLAAVLGGAGIGAQTPALTKYCRVQLEHVGEKAVTISIGTGSDKELYKQIKNEDSSFVGKTFAYTIDVVNYMAQHGWELVTAQTYGRQGDDFMIFKRSSRQ